MFRSRFTEVFPGKCPHFGPQDIEKGIVETTPSPEIQQLLCALLGLVLNRKKPVEYVHPIHAREAVLSEKSLCYKDIQRIRWLTTGCADRRTSYGRALEEAVLSHKSQWPHKWNGRNPLHGGNDFNNMSPSERVCNPTQPCRYLHAMLNEDAAQSPPHPGHVGARLLRSGVRHDQGKVQASPAQRRRKPASICTALGY